MTAPFPKIARPHVPVRRLTLLTGYIGYQAVCHHCDWSFDGNHKGTRAFVDEQARWHRDAHRAGRVEYPA